MKHHNVNQIINELSLINKASSPWGLILIGLPGSGKSTFVNKVLEEFPNTHIASTDNMIDQIALEKGVTYSEAFNKHVNMNLLKKQMIFGITANANAHNNIINDQTNMSRKSRAEKIALMPHYKLIAVCFEVPAAELDRRLKEREIATGKHIPKSVLVNMLLSYNAPSKTEGFHDIFMLN